MALTRRHLTFQFRLSSDAVAKSGEFTAGGDTVMLSGLRAHVDVTNANGFQMAEAGLRIYGMPADVMNRLTILGTRLGGASLNSVVVTASDDDGNQSVPFTGTINEAWVDANASPEVAFVCSAFTGLYDAIKPVPPTSYQGTVDAATIVQSIASQMTPEGGGAGTAGLAFQNNGVTAQISNPYLAGTLLDQLKRISIAADFEYERSATAITIWPRGKSQGDQVPLISKDTGMVGYPTHTQSGINVQTLYNPQITQNSLIQVESILKPANGQWRVSSVGHALESETPNGQWFTTIECALYLSPVDTGDR